MDETEQDALLGRIESRRRWRVIKFRALIAIGCVVAAAIGTALVLTL